VVAASEPIGGEERCGGRLKCSVIDVIIHCGLFDKNKREERERERERGVGCEVVNVKVLCLIQRSGSGRVKWKTKEEVEG